MTDKPRACEGGQTVEADVFGTMEHMEECQACGACVRFDLMDHKFFGFANTCPDKKVS